MIIELLKKMAGMTSLELKWKISKTLHNKYVISHRKEENYFLYYRSYRYALCHNANRKKYDVVQYMSARPNPGAGIGHQMANWIAGYWFAGQFGLEFAHIPFSGQKTPFKSNGWDKFLGFGDDTVKYDDLLKKGYRSVLLPLFNENNPEEISKIHKIIQAYQGQNVVFLLEQDQFYAAQYGVIDYIQSKFYNCKERNNDYLRFEKQEYNIVVHVRRGDIVLEPGQKDPGLQKRWLDNSYFITLMDEVLKKIKTEKKIHIWIMSQGREEDYLEFAKFENVTFCLDMSAQESFLHMVYADALITSKSSFSYKPALLNRNLKICPAVFWHGYPKAKDWWLADNHGHLIKSEEELNEKY